MDDACSCHTNPPCNFCVSLDEDETNAYANGGRDGLRDFRAARDHAREAEPSVTEPLSFTVGSFRFDLPPDDNGGFSGDVEAVHPDFGASVVKLEDGTFNASWSLGFEFEDGADGTTPEEAMRAALASFPKMLDDEARRLDALAKHLRDGLRHARQEFLVAARELPAENQRRLLESVEDGGDS